MRRDMAAAPRVDVPGDIILEPEERVLMATHPLFLWEPLVLIWLVLGGLGLYGFGVRDTLIATIGTVTFLAVGLLLLVTWIPWRGRWFVLTDRRVIARWGVLNRNQAALLLDRIQDASLSRPFPLSLIRDYGVLHLESAGEHAEERISAGLRELGMTRATAFYRTLTDAQTKESTDTTVRV